MSACFDFLLHPMPFAVRHGIPSCARCGYIETLHGDILTDSPYIVANVAENALTTAKSVRRETARLTSLGASWVSLPLVATADQHLVIAPYLYDVESVPFYRMTCDEIPYPRFTAKTVTTDIGLQLHVESTPNDMTSTVLLAELERMKGRRYVITSHNPYVVRRFANLDHPSAYIARSGELLMESVMIAQDAHADMIWFDARTTNIGDFEWYEACDIAPHMFFGAYDATKRDVPELLDHGVTGINGKSIKKLSKTIRTYTGDTK